MFSIRGSLQQHFKNHHKEIIDLSQEIYHGMPVYSALAPVGITTYATHEAWEGLENAISTSTSCWGAAGFGSSRCRSKSGAEPALRCGLWRSEGEET